MKRRLTIRQRLIKSLEKRIKVVCVKRGQYGREVFVTPPYTRYHLEIDGTYESTGSRREIIAARKWLIQDRASNLMRDAALLQHQGFKVTFPS